MNYAHKITFAASRVTQRFLNPRPVQLIGLGTQKSGTHSIARMFDKNYRSLHEGSSKRLIPVVLDYRQGKASFTQLKYQLILRDYLSYPVVDVAYYYGEIAGELVQIFPNAKFIITIRDCYTWFQSLVSQMLVTDKISITSPHLQEFLPLRDFIFGHHSEQEYHKGEEALRDRKLPSLTSYFKYWNQFNRHLLEVIPDNRRMVIPTSQIRNKIPEIAAFTGISEQEIEPTRSHSFKQKGYLLDVWSTIDQELIEQIAQEHCGELLTEFFPTTRSIETAIKRK